MSSYAICSLNKCTTLLEVPPDCAPDCEKEKAENEKAEKARRQAELAESYENFIRTPPIKGRQIVLSGYDSISNNSKCSCGLDSRCVAR